MNESRYLMFYIVVRFLPVLAGIGELVLGIMIAAGRVKSVKVLGIGFIMESISSLLSGAASLCALLVSAKVYSSYSVGITYISALCTIAGLVCMCIFLHKNYGRKLIYIPVFAIQTGGWIFSRVANIMLVRVAVTSNAGAWIALTHSISSFAVSAAVAVIIITVLFKNRDSEKVIPRAWLCKTIALACSFSGVLLNSINYLGEINGIKALRSSEILIYMPILMLAMVNLILPLYTTIMTFRSGNSGAGGTGADH